jgi:RNA polymerase sigma factor (sigma-70 family)
LAFVKNIPTNTITDADLLHAFKQNDDAQSLSILYQRYMDLVFGVCLKYLKDTAASKDAVMDIYVHINSKLKTHQVENFKGWLHIVAKNYCLMKLRSPKNMPTTEFDASFMQSVQNNHLANEVAEKELILLQMEACIETLIVEQKQTIQLFFLQQKCYNEIAEITGFEWSKVRSFIQNGKRNLKICMDNNAINLA